MQDIAALKEFLVRTPFFGGLDDAALERLIAMLALRSYPAGAAVFRAGDTGTSMFIVQSGELVGRQSGGGRDVKMMRFRSGDFFGETTLIEMQPRPITVIAEAPAILLELTGANLYKLYKEDVRGYVMVLQNINRELCRRLRRAVGRISEIAQDSDDDVTQIGQEIPTRR